MLQGSVLGKGGLKMIQEETGHPDTKVVTFTGDLSVHRGREVKETLLAALTAGKQLVIEFADYEGADLSFIQLLCSAHRTCALSGTPLKLGATTPARFIKTVDEAGFLRDKCCVFSKDKTCLWLRGSRTGAR